MGAVMVNGRELDGPPPGVGFETVTWTVPGVASAEAGIFADKEVCPKTWGVDAVTAPKFNAAFCAKLVPKALIWMENRPPAITLVGEMEPKVGTGYVPTFTVNGTLL